MSYSSKGYIPWSGHQTVLMIASTEDRLDRRMSDRPHAE
jgi:hypothetical protein